MAHYAFLDDDNFVVQVITGIDETEIIEGLDPETWYAQFKGLRCKRTSYNGNIRKNYAGVGYFYDENLDAFIAPQPFPSWVLNQDCQWVAPIDKPDGENLYEWNEELGEWLATTL